MLSDSGLLNNLNVASVLSKKFTGLVMLLWLQTIIVQAYDVIVKASKMEPF